MSDQRFALHAEHVVLPESCENAYLVIEGDRIADVSYVAPEGVELVDLGAAWIAPGFVETHAHGYAGCDVMDADPVAFNKSCSELLRCGTTSWLATTLTASPESTKEACAAVREALELRAPNYVGARVPGIFLEGPFFCEKYKGAQNPNYLIDPDLALLDEWQEASGGLIKKSALAPERVGSVDYVKGCVERGVVAALAHSDASYEEARAALDAGASVFVHTYNAMRPLTHRDPGMVGCAMTSDDAYAELICDGHHVNPVAVDALVRAKGWEKIVLITDSIAGAGLEDGDYFIGELPIVISEGTARLRDGGNLAGSVLRLDAAVKNVVEWGVCTPEQALRMASENAARSSGLLDVAGVIERGRLADLVVMSPELELQAVYFAGKVVA